MPKRQLQGTVVSDKANKTVSVLVQRQFLHPVYKKTIRTTKKYAAHDETNQFKTGDKVTIEESKPISKSKKWVVIDGVHSVHNEIIAETALQPKAAKNETKKPASKKKAG
jgi:small subunit ribosomal protein S17